MVWESVTHCHDLSGKLPLARARLWPSTCVGSPAPHLVENLRGIFPLDTHAPVEAAAFEGERVVFLVAPEKVARSIPTEILKTILMLSSLSTIHQPASATITPAN